MEKITELFYACWAVLGQMSPYLILGFLISGILSVLVSPRWVEKHLGSSRIGSIIKATLLGVPLPLCSCGVIPVSASLRRSGASKGATTAFLISTPQTGVDSILATYGLLGPVFAVLRPLAALLTGIIGGILVSAIDSSDEKTASAAITKIQDNDEPELPFGQKFYAAIKYAFMTLPGEISRAMIVGVIIAGLISTFVSGNFVSQYISNYYLTMLVMLGIGIPMYVCSTASIPIALGFMHMGVTPGAAFVFLVSGPATNAAAITVVWKILGKTSAIIYLMTVLTGSLAGGILFDHFGKSFSSLSQNPTQACHASLTMIETVSGIIMLLIMAGAFFSRFMRSGNSHNCCSACEKPADLVVKVEGMSCGNCANAVSRAISDIAGVASVKVMLTEKQAMIYGTSLKKDEIVNAINSLGYTAKVEN